jgi:DNA-binding transcriptional LysR family regulator
MRPPISRPEFSSIRVSTERLLAAVPPSHPASSAEALSIKDFDGQPFVMYSPYESRYFHDLVLAQFTRANVMPRYVQHLSQIHSIVAMVKAGLGLAIVPESAAGFGGGDVMMKPLRLRTPAPAELYLVWRNDFDNPLLPFLLDIVGTMTAAERR